MIKNTYKKFKGFSQDYELKVQKLRLKNSKESSSKISLSSTNSNQSNFKISINSKGTQINNKTIIIKSNTTITGFNYRSGDTKSRVDVGGTASASLNYIDRDSANEKELDEELSNTYTLEKQLSKDELDNTKKELREQGAEALRRDVISLNHDKDLTKEDHLEIVRNSVQKFHEQTGKKAEVYMSFHTNTEHKHVHLNSVGSKDDIKLSKEQLQHFKVIVANETKNRLEEKELKHSLDKYIEREEKTLERHQNLEKVMSNSKQELTSLSNERDAKLEQAFSKFTNHIEFSKDELKQLNQLQKTSGYVQYLEKNPSDENNTKLQEAKKWEQNIKAKISLETEDKFKYMQKQIEEFKHSTEVRNINKDFLVKQEALLNRTASQAKELGFSKTEETLNRKAKELSEDKLKNISKDKALEIKTKEVKQDKHLTHSQQIDKAIDGKLDNKMNGLQY